MSNKFVITWHLPLWLHCHPRHCHPVSAELSPHQLKAKVEKSRF